MPDNEQTPQPVPGATAIDRIKAARSKRSRYQRLVAKQAADAAKIAPMQFDYAHMNWIRGKVQKQMCENTAVILETVGQAINPKNSHKATYYTIVQRGCKNAKRNGSRFCQECSDIYHESKK